MSDYNSIRWVSATRAAKRLGLSVSGVRHLVREHQIERELVDLGDHHPPMRIYRWDRLEACRRDRALARDEHRADQGGRLRMAKASLQSVQKKTGTHNR